MPGAEELSLSPAPGLRVSWGAAGIAALATLPSDDAAFPTPQIDGALEPGQELRLIALAVADGPQVTVAALRPADARGHDEDLVAALVRDSAGATEDVEEALISTEYAADGSVRRIGLELYTPGEQYPLRIGADAARVGSERQGERRVERVALKASVGGRTGGGLLEVARPVHDT